MNKKGKKQLKRNLNYCEFFTKDGLVEAKLDLLKEIVNNFPLIKPNRKINKMCSDYLKNGSWVIVDKYMIEEEFLDNVKKEFNPKEWIMTNTKIANDDSHILYRERYFIKDYDFCWNYLMKNKKALKSIAEDKENTLKRWGEIIDGKDYKSDIENISLSKNRMGDISSKQLKNEIKSGIRSHVLGEMTPIEYKEIIELIELDGGIAYLKDGHKIITDSEYLSLKYMGEYTKRKLDL